MICILTNTATFNQPECAEWAMLVAMVVMINNLINVLLNCEYENCFVRVRMRENESKCHSQGK